MLRILLAGAIALALSACATLPAVPPAAVVAQADARLTQIEQGYADAKRFAALFLPMLPDAQRLRIEAAAAVVERALAAARLAVTAADRVLAIQAASDAVAQFRFISGS